VLNNHAQLKLLGARCLEDTIGKTDFDFYPPEMAGIFHEDDERVMSTGFALVDHEELIQPKNGRVLWLSTTKVPLRDNDGNIVGLLGIARDITERRQASEKVQQQAAIIDQAHDAILLLDLESRITYVNAASEKMLGRTAAELIGKTFFEVTPPTDHEQYRAALRDTITKGSWKGEVLIHSKDGREVSMDVRRSLIRDANGAPAAILSINSDITEAKKAAALALRNQRLESLGTLAGGIAHDLNNVLAPILMSIALLRLKVPDAGGQRLLGLLEQNAERGAQLVRQVLAFGRGVEGEKTLIQVSHIAREIEQIVKDTFPKTVTFEICGEKSPWPVTGDATQIHQVLLNLCVNSRDAMANGGKITLKLENRLLDETLASMNAGSKPGPYLAISVSDTGSGIPAKVRDRIFEPFFTTKDLGKGTGLGLSTSLGIVQNHGGFMNVASELGVGTTFTINLPASMDKEAKETAAAAGAKKLIMGNNELLLVVDDEEPILDAATSTLQRFGYRVLVASNGATAVSLYALNRTSIAAVLTDMAMPIMDGPALAIALRSINPNVVIIGSSGLGGVSSLTRSSNAGFTYFIPKPYSAETLLSVIARALGKAPAGKEPRKPAGRGAEGRRADHAAELQPGRGAERGEARGYERRDFQRGDDPARPRPARSSDGGHPQRTRAVRGAAGRPAPACHVPHELPDPGHLLGRAADPAQSPGALRPPPRLDKHRLSLRGHGHAPLHQAARPVLPVRPGAPRQLVQPGPARGLPVLHLGLREQEGLIRDGTPADVPAAVCRRIIFAQGLYALGALLCVLDTRLSIAFIILTQLYYAIAPGFGRRA
jgi:PAS domain S-box-containing protein